MKSSPLILLILSLFLFGCVTKQVEFPQADIVYQAIDFLDYGESTNKLVSFINADGSNDVIIPLQIRPSHPVFSIEDGGLLFLHAKDPTSVFGYAGKPVFLTTSGKYKTCDIPGGGYDYSFAIPDTGDILVNSDYGLVSVDINTCEVVKTFVELNDEISFRLIASAHISQLGSKIVFAADWGVRGAKTMARIMILDLQTGEIAEMPFTGGNPTLSPDDLQLAYMGIDGIYVSDIQSQKSRLLVPVDLRPVELAERSPYPFWSPDGKWLVYHKCTNNLCYRLEDFSIFKVNVATGEETKIKDGGMFPIWVN